ncbi:MAG: (Fe-S)-binding protein, partial [candidate division KSB1 bacterium]|nr:(Fe-S)-binding protein [candidate division KSB1 bacterium]
PGGQGARPRGFILQGRQAIFSLPESEPVIGNVISETALGQCTSCGACENICPVGIEHLQVLTGAKRAQALAIGTGMVATEFLQSIERYGNAFGKPKDARKQLIEELEIPYYEQGKTEYLLWLGCVWSYNPDARSSLEAMVKVLKAAGVSFGVLENETCSGHHSRRQGEEMQFQSLAQENIDSMQERRGREEREERGEREKRRRERRERGERREEKDPRSVPALPAHHRARIS